MRRSEYANTRRAQLKQLAERRYRRLFLQVEQSPQSKNIRAVDAIAFQQALLTKLESKQQLAYRGHVVLQFEFYNKSKTPPAIYKLPKNYLDLMEAPRADSGITRQHLLFRSDRQVKGLIVRYHVDGMFDEPQVVLHAEPFRDFLADAKLVDRISRNDFADDGERRFRSRRDAPFRTETAVLDESEKLAEFESEAESYRRLLGDDALEAMHFMMRQSAQQEFLLSQDRFVCSSLLTLFQYHANTRKLPSDDPRVRILAASRNSMISPHLMLELHHAPRRHGDSEKFQQELETALQGFKKKYALLFPLATPLNVTVLMVPPSGGGKDLDNLARLILPKLHDVWAPPSHFVHAVCASKHGDISSYWQSEKEALPKQQQQSITEYRIFEIPRLPGDPQEGLVRLAIGAGFLPIEFREQIDAYLDAWRDAVEY